jgi:hypothetical protein
LFFGDVSEQVHDMRKTKAVDQIAKRPHRFGLSSGQLHAMVVTPAPWLRVLLFAQLAQDGSRYIIARRAPNARLYRPLTVVSE